MDARRGPTSIDRPPEVAASVQPVIARTMLTSRSDVMTVATTASALLHLIGVVIMGLLPQYPSPSSNDGRWSNRKGLYCGMTAVRKAGCA